MVGRWDILILALCSCVLTAQLNRKCGPGFSWNKTKRHCIDYDECRDSYGPPRGPCVEHSTCYNINGSYFCQCVNGFTPSMDVVTFKADDRVKCDDINECSKDKGICEPHATCRNTIGNYSCDCHNGFIRSDGVNNTACRDIDECQGEDICGQNAKCNNTPGSYYCICNAGFRLKSGKSSFTGNEEKCQDICVIDKTICGNGTCYRGASGHYCACHAGFTNYGINGSRCTAQDCDIFEDKNNLAEKSHIAHDIIVQLKESCVSLTESESPPQLQGEGLLQKLLSLIDELLSRPPLNDNRKVSSFLDIVENVLRLIGPSLDTPRKKTSSVHTEVELLVFKGADLPKGAVNASSEHAQLDIQLETAAGDPSYYPGFTTLSLLSYGNLEKYAEGYYDGMERKKNQNFQINSKVVTVTVSNRNTSHLEEPVNMKFYHLNRADKSHICVFWDSSEKGGTWSSRGCKVVKSTPEYTVCSSTHLSSFAVLMALYDIENKFELQLISWVGLSLSLVCLFMCILTFSFIRSIQSPRTTIHLHLCICLFIAMFIFLVGISRTENRVGCAVVAGLLHFFFLAAFCWMCLEGIQLFRMVVLVFNTSFKTLYMMAGGYGVPAVIVAVTALVNANGYGNEKYCWLNLDSIWSFFGPACVIIIVNIFFFLITVWKLAQKFTSLNPDLDSLQKIKAFTITAVAQLCVLGTMWIFGCFQFDEGTVAMSYLFTIFGSLQGVMLFVMHCLFSKQVREEYGNILSRFCAPRRKTYSEFGYSQSSKVHATKSSQDTGESQI